MTELRVMVYPTTWCLWPVWVPTIGCRRICLGPLVIEWKTADWRP